MFWILLIVLGVIGGGAALVAVASARSKQLAAGSGGGAPKALPGSSDKLLERTARDLRVGDVLTIDGRDFLCEGVVGYDEDGHRWSGGRIVDGTDEQWLLAGIERAGGGALRLLVPEKSVDVSGYPAETIVLGQVTFALDKRGTATCKLSGELPGLGSHARPAHHVERCRWWLYSAPGDDTLLIEQWGSDYRALRGKKVAEATIDLLPGS
jgi:hypothetical protein